MELEEEEVQEEIDELLEEHDAIAILWGLSRALQSRADDHRGAAKARYMRLSDAVALFADQVEETMDARRNPARRGAGGLTEEEAAEVGSAAAAKVFSIFEGGKGVILTTIRTVAEMLYAKGAISKEASWAIEGAANTELKPSGYYRSD